MNVYLVYFISFYSCCLACSGAGFEERCARVQSRVGLPEVDRGALAQDAPATATEGALLPAAVHTCHRTQGPAHSSRVERTYRTRTVLIVKLLSFLTHNHKYLWVLVLAIPTCTCIF